MARGGSDTSAVPTLDGPRVVRSAPGWAVGQGSEKELNPSQPTQHFSRHSSVTSDLRLAVGDHLNAASVAHGRVEVRSRSATCEATRAPASLQILADASCRTFQCTPTCPQAERWSPCSSRPPPQEQRVGVSGRGRRSLRSSRARYSSSASGCRPSSRRSAAIRDVAIRADGCVFSPIRKIVYSNVGGWICRDQCTSTASNQQTAVIPCLTPT